MLLPASVACWTPVDDTVRVRVDFDRSASTFEPVKLKVTVAGDRRRLDTPAQVWVRVSLPQSMVFINGLLRWEGTIAPGQRKTFETTVAAIVEGRSTALVTASYSFHDLAGNQRSGGTGEAMGITARQPRMKVNYASYGPHDSGMSQDDALLNVGEAPRLVIFPGPLESYDVLERMGLAPSTRDSHTYYGVTSQLFRQDTYVVGLFDRRRSTTGFHVGLLDIHGGVEFDFVVTAPRPDWPVEEREVSSYVLYPIGWPPDQEATEIVVRINGEVAGRQPITRPRGPQHPIEIPVHFLPKTAP